jgi:hypothetical protein
MFERTTLKLRGYKVPFLITAQHWYIHTHTHTHTHAHMYNLQMCMVSTIRVFEGAFEGAFEGDLKWHFGD